MEDAIFAGREKLRELAMHPLADINLDGFNEIPRATVLAWYFFLTLHDILEHDCPIKGRLREIMERKTPLKANSDSEACDALDLILRSVYPDVEERERLICEEWGYVDEEIAHRISTLAEHIDEIVK